jgi:hypothetical protein
MFLPGGFLSGELLPWILLAPSVPLLAALIRRPSFTPSSISLLICTVVSLLTGIFGFLSSDKELNRAVLHFTIFLDAACAFLLLYIHSHWPKLQQLVMTLGLLFAGIFITLMLFGDEGQGLSVLIKAGYTLIFLGALAVIISHMQHISQYITVSPAFWISAGICFQYGLMGLLLLMNPHDDPARLLSYPDFGIMYTVIYVLRFLFFSIAIFLYKPLEYREKKDIRDRQRPL